MCEKCGQPNYMHIDGVGGFDPRRCRSCKIDFVGVSGDKNNEYRAMVSEKGLSLEEKESSSTPVNIQRREFSKRNIEKKDNGSFRLRVDIEE